MNGNASLLFKVFMVASLCKLPKCKYFRHFKGLYFQDCMMVFIYYMEVINSNDIIKLLDSSCCKKKSSWAYLSCPLGAYLLSKTKMWTKVRMHLILTNLFQ